MSQPEDGGSTFFRNVRTIPGYTVLNCIW